MISRRCFLASLAAPVLAQPPERIIDIHQHTQYGGRTDDQLIAHQRQMGVTQTNLMPWIGQPMLPNNGGSKYGLPGQAGGDDSVVAVARRLPKEFFFFSNEVDGLPTTRAVLVKYLKMGAHGIGEQKFHVQIDSKEIDEVASIAQEYQVPITLHFQYETFNLGIENLPKVLARHPRVNFIGHAQTFWANIDKNCKQADMYPTGRVVAGGLTDRVLSDYANMYGDMSANSGLNGMTRDEDHARGFLQRHQDKLMFGSDCTDHEANGLKCLGGKILAAIRRLAPDEAAKRKILCDNAAKLLKIPA